MKRAELAPHLFRGSNSGMSSIVAAAATHMMVYTGYKNLEIENKMGTIRLLWQHHDLDYLWKSRIQTVTLQISKLDPTDHRQGQPDIAISQYDMWTENTKVPNFSMLVRSLHLYLSMPSIVIFKIIGHHRHLHPLRDVWNCSPLDFQYWALMEPTCLNTEITENGRKIHDKRISRFQFSAHRTCRYFTSHLVLQKITGWGKQGSKTCLSSLWGCKDIKPNQIYSGNTNIKIDIYTLFLAASTIMGSRRASRNPKLKLLKPFRK